jgi:hypothetical protein
MNWKRVIAIVFSVVCSVLSIGMLLLSREDSTLMYGAVIFFTLSLSLLWILYAFFDRKQYAYATLWFIVSSICVTGIIFPTYWITEKISAARDTVYESNFRNIQVTNLRDEVLLTEKGNSIGIRLHYTVTVSQSGRYSPVPSVSDGKSRAGHFYPVSVRIDPLPQIDGSGTSLAGTYRAGIPYNISVDLRPNFLLSNYETGEACVYFVDADEENMIKNAQPQRLEVDIDGTSLSRYYGQGIQYLKNDYTMKDVYDSIDKEGLSRCASR